MAHEKRTVTLIPGDGIGPEIAAACRRVLEAAGAPLEFEECAAGKKVFEAGVASGVPSETIESLSRTGIALKGPLETPVGHGGKSANVTIRKLFEMYGNVRPVKDLPGVPGLFAGRHLDLVVIRENVEDLYAGIEHMQTPGVAQCLKLISRKGCEKIVRLAFEYARSQGRKRVHCATKANIMKLTEGLLKRTFEELAADYPDIQSEHIIIDNCAHQLVRYPEQFEVIVSTNMNGDILSDLTAGMTGGLGLAPSANIGDQASMFESVHGSAPDIAGKDVANPTAFILSSVMMLRHLGMFEIADKIENAILVTFEEGRTLTLDVGGETNASSTTHYTDALINNLGRTSDRFPVREHKPMKMHSFPEQAAIVTIDDRITIGADVFIESNLTAGALGRSLDELAGNTPLRLKMISNRGTKVYPDQVGVTDMVDHWRCRFVMRDADTAMTDETLVGLLQKVSPEHRWMHIEKLERYDGENAFTRAQGED